MSKPHSLSALASQQGHVRIIDALNNKVLLTTDRIVQQVVVSIWERSKSLDVIFQVQYSRLNKPAKIVQITAGAQTMSILSKYHYSTLLSRPGVKSLRLTFYTRLPGVALAGYSRLPVVPG